MLSALDLARRVAAGTLLPRDVIDLCAKAIAIREAEVGAFTALDLEAARRDAQPELARMPLCGLPVGIKDIYDTADLPTAYGSPIYAGHRPKTDAAMARARRKASRRSPQARGAEQGRRSERDTNELHAPWRGECERGC